MESMQKRSCYFLVLFNYKNNLIIVRLLVISNMISDKFIVSHKVLENYSLSLRSQKKHEILKKKLLS